MTKSALVIHLHGIGDWMMFSACYRCLISDYKIDVVTGLNSTRSFLSEVYGITNVAHFDIRRGINVLKLFLAVLLLKKRKYEIIYITAGMKDWKLWFFQFAFLFHHQVFCLSNRPKLFFKFKALLYNPDDHKFYNNKALLKWSLDLSQSHTFKTYFLPYNKITSPNSKQILIHPGNDSKNSYRRYPVSYYVDVILELTRSLSSEYTFVLIFGPQEIELLKEFDNLLGTNTYNVTYTIKPSFSTLIQLFQEGELLISNDSGLTHIAAGTSIKIINIFGPADPKDTAAVSENQFLVMPEISLECMPCVKPGGKYGCEAQTCLRSISPSRISKIVKNVL